MAGPILISRGERRVGVRRAPADYPIDLSASDVGVLNYNGVGGGTVLYAAQWPRLLPSDFTRRTDEGVADDWPLTYAELLPFYERTDRQFGISGLGGEKGRWTESADPEDTLVGGPCAFSCLES